jgi:ribosome biogenesis SPOUT family RNA methylase Rps3
MKYIIEHLEPKIYKWCLIEYMHISKIVGKENLIFTNVKSEKQRKQLKEIGTVYSESIKNIMSDFKNCCLLDSEAKKELSTDDEFDYLVLGGILGDDPPQKRTMNELGMLNLPLRNLGNRQMPTDNAVYVAKQIVDGKNFKNIAFQDDLIIPLKEGEEIILPFRYALVDGKPLISDELLHHIKTKKGF